jgi:hypothetical protein
MHKLTHVDDNEVGAEVGAGTRRVSYKCREEVCGLVAVGASLERSNGGDVGGGGRHCTWPRAVEWWRRCGARRGARLGHGGHRPSRGRGQARGTTGVPLGAGRGRQMEGARPGGGGEAGPWRGVVGGRWRGRSKDGR